jgi:hypothetical protein
MPRRLSTRVLAVVVILAMAALGLHVALHWQAQDFDNCQACHVGHAAIPQPAVRLATQKATLVARFAPPEAPAIDVEPVCTHRIPRAPPA